MKERRIFTLLPSLTVTVIFLTVLAAKGIFPFGKETIDYYDMGQINAPLFYHAWDVLHGRASLFFNWYINEGQNIAMAASNQWNLSPFILTFLFVPRINLMRFLSVYIGMHFVGMTVSMQYFLYRVTRKTPWYFRYVFSVAYGMCGYTLTHYTSPTFLDSAVFLPLIILGLYMLLKQGKTYLYIFMLALSLIISYYLGAIDMIYLLIISGAYITFLCDKDKQADRALRLALSTVSGIILSAFVLVPVYFSLAKSSRINENYDSSLSGTVISVLSAIGADQYYVKFWQLFAMEAALVIIIYGMWKFRKEGKKTLFAFIFCFAPCALIPFESVNLIWHLLSYFHYPIRCGYLIPFSLLVLASYYAGRLYSNELSSGLSSGLSGTRIREHIPAMVMATLIASGTLILFFKHDIWAVETLFKASLIFSAVFFCIYLVIFSIRRIPKQVFIWFVLSELIVGSAIGYGKPHIYDHFFSDPEQNGTFVEEALKLSSDLDIAPSPLYRIKNPDTSLNANYGIIMNRATFCGWAQTLSRPFQKGAEKFGYSTHFMRILDSGGTAFTDALLGITESLSLTDDEKRMPSVYAQRAFNGTYHLYDLKNTFPYINTVVTGDEAIGDMDMVELHNRLFKMLLAGAGNDGAGSGNDGAGSGNDGAGDIASYLCRGEKKDGETELKKEISGRKLLYLRKGKTDKIIVNGKAVPVPSISEPDNTAYPAWFNSNLICLGEFENETVSIICPVRSDIFELDIDKLEMLSEVLKRYADETGSPWELSADNHSLSFDITSKDDGTMAVLPVNPDEYSSITVNGRKVSGKNVCSLLTGVPLDPGENLVKISFLPKGLIPGAVISIIMLLFLILLYAVSLSKTGNIADSGNSGNIGNNVDAGNISFNEAAGTISLFLLRILWFSLILFVYMIPIASFFIHQILKRL